MKRHTDKLKTKGERLKVAGTMSGTSLDGVDVGVIETDGETIFAFGPKAYRAYSDDERDRLRAALGKWSGPEVEAAAQVVDRAHREILTDFSVDLVGFHGQTLAHAPGREGTLQVGDGQGLANDLGCPVVWDFRSADVELGGEGAPLAPFFHFACARRVGLEKPVAFLNLGGVGNLTWVDPSKAAPDIAGALLAFDTGPANAPINDYVQRHLSRAFDEDGHIAAEGQINVDAIEQFLRNGYFLRVPPKSLDRNDFSSITDYVDGLDHADAVATLTAMSAAAVAQGFRHCPQPPAALFVTGGGRLNPALMKTLSGLLSCPLHPVEDLGLDGDMLEAQAFAYLAVRVARGLPTSCPSTTGVRAAVGGGVLSLPQAQSPAA